jgi:hypothetical protein
MMIGDRKPITPEITRMIAKALGLGSFVLELHLTDYTRGSMRMKNGQCFWLTDGRRVELTKGTDGVFIGTVTNQPDIHRPDPLVPDPDPLV